MVLLFLSGWLLERLRAERKGLATLIRIEDGEWEVEWEDLSEGRAADTSTMTLLREQVPTQALREARVGRPELLLPVLPDGWKRRLKLEIQYLYSHSATSVN